MFDLSSIGLKIKELRKRKNLSQEELAELIDINFRTIQRIETGRNTPSLETLSKLAEAFEINIQDFFNVGHQKNRKDIIDEINKIAQSLDDVKLHDFYKAIYTFYN
ncbi:helix-turn-helix transcriptional regulator [bacterium]|nr:helix-turn-helix transcriptional regulator [bacterium]